MTTLRKIQICYLSPGQAFVLACNPDVRGELVEYYEGSDVKVRIYKGSKCEIVHWSNAAEVYPISKEELSSVQTAVKEIQQEKFKKLREAAAITKEVQGPKTDRYGCRLSSDSSKINTAISTTPQSLEEIAEKAKVTPKRALSHINFWSKKKEGIGAFLEEKGGKYWVKV